MSRQECETVNSRCGEARGVYTKTGLLCLHGYGDLFIRCRLFVSLRQRSHSVGVAMIGDVGQFYTAPKPPFQNIFVSNLSK